MLICHVCRTNNVPIYGNVLWCDDCIDELFKTGEDMMDFIHRKQAEHDARKNGQAAEGGHGETQTSSPVVE